MTFDYSISQSSSGFNYEPRVRVWLRNLENGIEVPIFALVDSGATHTVAHSQVADILNIERSRDIHRFVGIGGEVGGFTHTVGLRLDGDPHVHEITCAFADVSDMGALLGQDGFFDHFKVSFEKYRGAFSVVKPRLEKATAAG